MRLTLDLRTNYVVSRNQVYVVYRCAPRVLCGSYSRGGYAKDLNLEAVYRCLEIIFGDKRVAQSDKRTVVQLKVQSR